MRPIDADELKRYMCNKCGERSTCEYQGYGCSTLADIDEQPTIEAEPVKHGRWMYPFYCSECTFVPYYSSDITYYYCPNCGAKMDGGAD